MKSFRSKEHLQEQTNCAGTITAPPFAPDGLLNSRNIWLHHDHWALTSKNKLHIKRKIDTVPGGRKGHYRCLCVQVCVCLMWHIWVRLCESEWACTGVNLYDIPQLSPSATTYPADCGHMSVYFSLPPAGHECAYLIELKACLQSCRLPIFFLMWESKLLLLWLKWWVQFFGTRERASREGK